MKKTIQLIVAFSSFSIAFGAGTNDDSYCVCGEKNKKTADAKSAKDASALTKTSKSELSNWEERSAYYTAKKAALLKEVESARFHVASDEKPFDVRVQALGKSTTLSVYSSDSVVTIFKLFSDKEGHLPHKWMFKGKELKSSIGTIHNAGIDGSKEIWCY